jgi:signal transduction histidine kinase/putative methionine-R-sulfoxide reductase with GAF domain
VQPVLDVVAERASRLCNSPYARVLLVEGDVLRMAANYARDPSEELAPSPPMPLRRSSLNGRAVLDRQTIHHADVLPLLETEYPDARPNVERGGTRAVLVVPLVRGESAFGSIIVFRRQPGLFAADQVALVENFARQAAIAIDNARLFNKTKEALEHQTATGAILRVISSSPTNVQPVFDIISERARKLCDAEFSVVTRVEGDQIHFASFDGVSDEAKETLRRVHPMPLSIETATARAVRRRGVVQIADVMDDPSYAQKDAAAVAGWRGALAVPMIREGQVIGAIFVAHRNAGLFADSKIELLKTFADQAVITIENVRLFNETKEALARQTATADILRAISSSPTDVQPVFDTIVATAKRLMNGHSSLVTVRRDDALHIAALSATTKTGDDALRQRFPVPLDSSSSRILPKAVRSGLPAMRIDTETDADVSPQEREMARTRGYRSALAVPIMRAGDAIGTISVTRPDPGSFSAREIELLQTFADQAVIAIENVRLFTELEARTTQLTRSVGELKALGEVGQAVSSTLDLETVLTTIASRAAGLAGMDWGAIHEYDEAGEEFHLRAMHNLPDELVDALRAAPVPKGEGAIGRMAVTREPLQFADITDKGSYQSRVREVLIRHGYRSVLAVPLLREDRLLGALVVARRRAGDFAVEVIELLKTFATQSALAIQNARLFREIEDKSRQLESASRHKSEFPANMSHELRTPLNAIIGFSEVLAERLFGEINEKQAEYIGDILQSGQHLLSLINDILDLSKIEAGRMELELSDFDLPGTIEQTVTLVRERAVRRGITLGRTIDECLGSIRADERKVKQVLLNLLSNALKFTPEGGKIDVRADVRDGVAEISVTDTGVGIAPEEQEVVFEEFRQVGATSKKVEGTGLGLAISRKFIELHGGRIWVKSQIGSGSTFSFTLPLR